jgi:hypothetical protein
MPYHYLTEALRDERRNSEEGKSQSLLAHTKTMSATGYLALLS